jgi:hypothetical protein
VSVAASVASAFEVGMTTEIMAPQRRPAAAHYRWWDEGGKGGQSANAESSAARRLIMAPVNIKGAPTGRPLQCVHNRESGLSI